MIDEALLREAVARREAAVHEQAVVDALLADLGDAAKAGSQAPCAAGATSYELS